MTRTLLIALLAGAACALAAGTPNTTAWGEDSAAPPEATSLPTTLPRLAALKPSTDEDKPLRLDETFNIDVADSTQLLNRPHWFELEVKAAGVRKLVITRSPVDKNATDNFSVKLIRPSSTEEYECFAPAAGEFHFYPVLEEGTYRIRIGSSGGNDKDRYRLSLVYDPCEVPEHLKTDAAAALARGVACLLKSKPADLDYRHKAAIEALVMMALAEGADKKDRAAVIASDYVAWLESLRQDEEKATWRGRKLSYIDADELYVQSIITLAMAEVAATGDAKAKAIAQAGAEFLLGAQLTSERCAAWKPAGKDNKCYGGWRYTGDAEDADISVTGWCMVGLLACDAAGITPAGTREALDTASSFIGHCYKDPNFRYIPDGESGDVRDSIGALMMLLMGEDGTNLKNAERVLDTHLPAGTQTMAGTNYAMYYAYYGTRANYLRGGKHWETWRSVLMRQLLRLQRPDGSWGGYGEEADMPRYTTAMGVMLLRMCLNDVPAYLRQEAKGF